MLKERVIETNEGIQDEITVDIFNVFARNMRDKGYNGVEDMIASGINNGDVLEVGPGPGFVGLELARKIKPHTMTALEISPAMIEVAKKNAAEYGIRVNYVLGNAIQMPFTDNSFDSVISNGSLHEWESPIQCFNEIARVLRTGGTYCITDMRRDVSSLKKNMIYYSTKPKEMRPGYLSSLNAAYTRTEIIELLRNSNLKHAHVKNQFFGLCIYGII